MVCPNSWPAGCAAVCGYWPDAASCRRPGASTPRPSGPLRSVQDRDGAHPLLALLREKFSTIALVWADGGYTGRMVTWAKQVLGLAVTIVKCSDDLRGFLVLPRRWVAERTFAWLTRYRRLVRIYKRKPEHHEP
ncbi:transposase [Nonomuraea sp. NPDC052116]|uniref:transposase n=1 Tax=Nonomuraea sp. NPDC052116 TaxID=3155665 RepID=UPI00344A7B8B